MEGRIGTAPEPRRRAWLALSAKRTCGGSARSDPLDGVRRTAAWITLRREHVNEHLLRLRPARLRVALAGIGQGGLNQPREVRLLLF